MPYPQTVAISTTAQASLRSMIVQLRQMEGQVNMYLRGLRDSLGLEGDDWVLQLEDGTFVRQSQEEKTNGVGAAASNPQGK